MVWDLIDNQGAVLFVCGSGSRMGSGVRDAILEIIKENCTDDDKEKWVDEYMNNLEDGRYELDVWG